jgi:hypothetical protein
MCKISRDKTKHECIHNNFRFVNAFGGGDFNYATLVVDHCGSMGLT